MKRAQRNPRTKKGTRTTLKEPLAEGIVPLMKSGRRRWSSMSYEELVAYAKKFMKEKGISGSMELEKADSGLYQALMRRKLLEEVGFEEKQRDWASMSDDELVAYAKKSMKEKGISGRYELVEADSGLYSALRKRKLLDRVGFRERGRNWASMNDDKLVAYAKRVMKKNGIRRKKELSKADSGLYKALRKRKLLDKVGFEGKYRGWASMSDDELVAYAKRFMKGNEMVVRRGLQRVDRGLYKALRRRKLLDKVRSGKKQRSWGKMSDDELVAYAKRFMKEKRIRGRKELEKADVGLYQALRKRKLLDRVGFEEKRRDWASMRNEELVSYAKRFLKEKGISGREELKKADSGLYGSLLKRKLLGRVFADIEKAKQREADDEVIRVLEEFST